MRNENEIVEAPQEERGIPGSRTRKKSRVRTLVIVVIAVALMGVGAWFGVVAINRFAATKLAEKAAAKKTEDEARKSAARSGDKDLSGEKSAITAAEAASAAAGLAVPAGAQANSPAANPQHPPMAGGPGAPATANAGPTMSDRDSHLYNDDLSVMPASSAKAGTAPGVSDGVAETLAALKGGSATNQQGGNGLLGGGSGKSNPFQDSLEASNIPDGQASFLPDLDFLLQRGSLIPCGAITRIDSTLPGAVKCMVLQDVYSANGHTILVRRGATAFGEQRQALMQGQARIGVLWDEIDDGPIKIVVNSPAADSLGATGFAAHVDNHFWARFGGALLVSLVGDFGQALSSRTVGGGSNQLTIGGSGNDATNVAQEVLRNTVNIPPTAYTNQGEITNIFVARHIDMRSVYQLVHK